MTPLNLYCTILYIVRSTEIKFCVVLCDWLSMLMSTNLVAARLDDKQLQWWLSEACTKDSFNTIYHSINVALPSASSSNGSWTGRLSGDTGILGSFSLGLFLDENASTY